MNFKILSMATAVLSITLAIVLGFLPEVIFWLFQVEADAAAYFIARRAAVMFFGLSIMFWSGRHASVSPLRQAICLGMAVMMGGLALLGAGEFLRGYAGPGIGLAILAEVGFAYAYWNIWRVSERDTVMPE